MWFWFWHAYALVAMYTAAMAGLQNDERSNAWAMLACGLFCMLCGLLWPLVMVVVFVAVLAGKL